MSSYSLDALDLAEIIDRVVFYRCEDHGPDRISGGRPNATDPRSPAMMLPYGSIWGRGLECSPLALPPDGTHRGHNDQHEARSECLPWLQVAEKGTRQSVARWWFLRQALAAPQMSYLGAGGRQAYIFGVLKHSCSSEREMLWMRPVS